MSDNKSMTAWGKRDDVRELRERLQTMLPNGNKLSQTELAALAQGAMMHGLDPLNGEIWMIPTRGLMIGIKGLRKKAREQMKGGNFFINFREIANEEERTRLRIPAGALAYEARLFDSENIMMYVNAVEKLTKAGCPFEVARDMLGDKPYTSGIGILKPGEPTKMDANQCARKRAEADAIKQRFDVPFGMAISDDDESDFAGEWVEGKKTESEEYVPDQKDIDEALAKQKRDRDALYGEREPKK